MKIIFLHRVWPVYGGGETVTVRLANEMIKRGFTVHVAYFKDSPEGKPKPYIDSRLICHRIEYVRFDEFSSDFFVDKRVAAYVSSELVKIIGSESIDIVHNQWWPAEFLKGVHEHTQAKVVKVLHMDVDIRRAFDFSGWKGRCFKLFYPLYRKMERYKNIRRADKYYKSCDKFVFLAPCFMEDYKRLTGLNVDENRLDFVFNPLVFSEYITEEERAEKRNTVLAVGRLSERHKKFTRMIELWRSVEADAAFDDWNLKMVGDGEDFGLYRDMIAQYGLKRISMEGFRHPLPYYKEARIFLMTSAYEGFPMTLIEAQQQGVVCVAMDTYESLHYILNDGENGVIVPDTGMLEKKVKQLMNNPVLLKRYADKGLQTCRQYDVEAVVDKWETLYKGLI